MDQRIARSSQRPPTVPHGPSMLFWSEFTLIQGLPGCLELRVHGACHSPPCFQSLRSINNTPHARKKPLLVSTMPSPSCDASTALIFGSPHCVVTSYGGQRAPVGTTYGLISIHRLPSLQWRTSQVQSGSCSEVTVSPSGVRLQGYKYPLKIHGTLSRTSVLNPTHPTHHR